MNCKKCGNTLPENAKFCVACGEKTEMPSAGAPSPAQQPETPTPQPTAQAIQASAPPLEGAPTAAFIDGGRAFTFFTKDPTWLNKVLLGGLIILIPIFGVLILMGYQLRIIKNVASGNEVPLPEWELGEQLKNGFTLFLYVFGFMIITGVPLFIFTNFVPIIGPIIGLLGNIFLSLYMIAAMAIIGAESDFGALFQFGRVFNIVKNNLVPLLFFSLFAFCAGLASLLGLIAFLIGILFTIIIAMMIYSHLYGQFYIVSRASNR